MPTVSPRMFTEGDIAPPRIGGGEMEYDVQFDRAPSQPEDNSLLSPKSLEAIGQPFHQDGSTYWLANGGNLHTDVRRIEYATGEGDSARIIAAYDLGGMEIIAALAREGGARAYRHAGITVPPTRDGKDFKSLGYHQNFTTIRQTDMDTVRGIWDTYQASRVWAWGGIVGKHGFELSQKARGIGWPSSLHARDRTTEGIKPMGWIKIADGDVYSIYENYGCPWVRVEGRVVDAGFSRWARWMSEAVGSLVLRFPERRELFGDKMPLSRIQFTQPVQALSRINKDLTFKKTYFTKTGKSITAIDANELFAEYGDYLRQRIQLPAEEHRAVDELFDIAARLRRVDIPNGDIRALAGRVDFAARLAYLWKKGFAPQEITSTNRDAVDHSLLWSRIEPHGPGYTYWNNIYTNPNLATQAPDPVGQDLIRRHIHQPCTTTRAALRSAVVTNPNLRNNSHVQISWRHIHNNHTPGYPAAHRRRSVWMEPYDHDLTQLVDIGGLPPA